MEIKDILRPQADHRVGYSPQTVSKTSLKPEEFGLRRLIRIPSKITAYFDRLKIKTVFKSDCAKDPRDDYYIIEATDGTRFHVDY